MAVYKRRNGSSIELGRRVGGGGEGDIYEVSSLPDLVAKIWANPDDLRVRKMQVLLGHPPRISPRVREKIDLAWPTDALYGDDGAMVGYLMPKVSLDDYRELVNYAFPITRRRIEERRGAEFSKEDILGIARNLAGVFLRLHSDNYLIGDVNRANFLVDVNGRAFVIDIDSMQARDPDTGEIHRCAVGTPDFIPPELVGKTFRDFDRVENHDLFGLAVLIFELLMNGVHPYDPIDQTGSHGSGQMRLDNIKSGYSPYANLDTVQALSLRYNEDTPTPELRESRRATLLAEMGMDATADFDTLLHGRVEPWLDLPLELRNLFIRAFRDGEQSRPNARDWIETIDRVLRDVRQQAATTAKPISTHPVSSINYPASELSQVRYYGRAVLSRVHSWYRGRPIRVLVVLIGLIIVALAAAELINRSRNFEPSPASPASSSSGRQNGVSVPPSEVVVPPTPPTSLQLPLPGLAPVPVDILTATPTSTPNPTLTPAPTFTPNPTLTPTPTVLATLTPVPTRTPRPLPTPIPIVNQDGYLLILEGGGPEEVSLDWDFAAYGNGIPTVTNDGSVNLSFSPVSHSADTAFITVEAKDDSRVGNGIVMIQITNELRNIVYLLVVEVQDAGEPTPTPTAIPHIRESGDVLVAEGGLTNFSFSWNRGVYGNGEPSITDGGPVNIWYSDIDHQDQQATITVGANDDSLVGNGHAEITISNQTGSMVYVLNVEVVDAGEATATPTSTPVPTFTPTPTSTPTPLVTPTPTTVPLPNLSLEVFRICVEGMACWPQTPNEDSVSGSLRVSITWRVANIGNGPTKSETDLRFYADGEYHEEEYLRYAFDIPILEPGESIEQRNQTLETPDSRWPLDFSLTGNNTIIAIVDMQDRVQEVGDDCRNLKVYRDRSSARNSTCDNVRYVDSLPFLPTPTPTPLFSPTPTPTTSPTPAPTPTPVPTQTPMPTRTPTPIGASAPSVGATVTISWDMFDGSGPSPSDVTYNIGLCDPSDCGRSRWLPSAFPPLGFLTWRNDDREMEVELEPGSYTAKAEVYTGNRTYRCTTDFKVNSRLDVVTTREDCNKAQHGQELKVR